jgi:hypothetical protein
VAAVALLAIVALLSLGMPARAQGYGLGLGLGFGNGNVLTGPTAPTSGQAVCNNAGVLGGCAIGSGTVFNAGTITAQTGEVAYAGNGSTLAFSGYSVLKPPASVHLASAGNGDSGGGNITIHWTHAATPAGTTVKADGTFTATSDLASGSIVPLTGALALTFNSGHAPDASTNITIDYNTGVQCNCSGTRECLFSNNLGSGNTFTIFNPINLPTAGNVTIAMKNVGAATSNMDWGTNFFGWTRGAGSLPSIWQAIQSDNYNWLTCLNSFVSGSSTSMLGWTDGTKVNFPGQCGSRIETGNIQIGIGDVYGALFWHTALPLDAGHLICGSTANCAAGSLGSCATGQKGNVSVIEDSTSVASEGQSCVGNSTNTALAFCNGTAWKCF